MSISTVAIQNFFNYLKTHNFDCFQIYYESSYENITNRIMEEAANNNILLHTHKLDYISVTNLISNFNNKNGYIFFYDAISRIGKAPEYLNILRNQFHSWNNKKLFRILDIKGYFNEVFSNSCEATYQINQSIIGLGKNSNMMYIADNNGTALEIKLNPTAWDNIDGRLELPDFTPSEVANGPLNVNGVICFTGGFLSQIPLASKYKLLDNPLKLIIQDSEIIQVDTTNTELKNDILAIIKDNKGNALVTEAGIGTNPGVKLLGRGLPFEERYAGFHLGIGGNLPNSFHWDLIFNQSEIYFDDKIIFNSQNGFMI